MPEIKKPKLAELSRSDRGTLMAKALIETMIENPDEILSARGTGQLRIYKDLLRDDQVKSCFEQRRTAITKAEWTIEPASESAEDLAIAKWITEELTRLKFDALTDKMLYARHYGYAVAETIPKVINGKLTFRDILVRDRSRFVFDENNKLRLRTELGKTIPMNDENFWVFSVGADHDDNPYGEGLAHALYWPVFFKRNGIKFWMIFLEKFSMPTAVAKLNHQQMNDPEAKAMALDVIDAIQADSGVVMPEDFIIELIEAKRSGTADYQVLKDSMDKAISKIILSQTMTTDDGSSNSQAQVHKGVKDDVIKADADLICESFNTIIARLVVWNYPNAKAPTVIRRTEPPEDLVQRAERDKKIGELGYEPTEEYITETYGAGWKKKENPLPPTANGVPAMGAEFAEVTQLTRERISHRQDQQSIADAAEYLGTKYHEMYGERVEKLMAFMEETDDVETFKKHLNDMLAEPASEKTAEFIEKASFYSRLMGVFKGK